VPGSGVAGTSFLGSAGAGASLGANLAVAAGNLGLALSLGGIATMITPVPQQPEAPGEGQGGFAFSGAINTSQEGIPVPVVYGEMIVGSVVLSTRLITNKIDDTSETKGGV
jgi:predicted phage tail protein